MATLALDRQTSAVRPPEIVEPDVRVYQNKERNILARVSSEIRKRWQGYQERGLIASDNLDDLTYNPVPSRRVINVNGKIMGRSRGIPLVFPFDDED